MEAAKHDKTTVFVRGVAFSTGPEDFEAHFSELGPVRTSFLVKDKGKTGHKGFGFVQYALPEDAQKAAEQLHNTEFQGRKLKVEAAVKRAPLNDRKKRKLGDTDNSGAVSAKPTDSGSKGAPQPASAATAVHVKQAAAKKPPKVSARASKKARKQQDGTKPAANPKQRLVRTVALGNLQSGTKEEALTMAHAAGKVESIEDPPSDLDMSHVRLKRDGCSGLVIFVIYDSVRTALAAVAKLHGQPLGKQTQKSAKRQKLGADDAVSEQLWARQVSGEGLHLKQWRVIIRNLAFQTKPAELKAALEAGGSFVWDLSLPKNTEGSLKGFAFATFMTRGHAESGIKATNGKVVAGRQVVVDWAMSKARFTDAALQASGRQGEGEADAAQPADSSPADGDGDASPAADAALRQDVQDTAEVIDPAAEHRMVQNVMDALLQDDDLLEGEAAVAPAVAPKLLKPAGRAPEEAEAAGKQSTAAKSSPADGVSKDQPGKLAKGSQNTAGGGQQAGARDSSKTVFVRALPADVSQDQLHLAFSKFGKLRSCRLVMNKETQQPKGTAFVEYWDTSAAQQAAAACQKAREGGSGGIMVGGRTVEVDLALSQDDARNLASGGRASSGPGKDNRNLYLAKEGTIEEGSAAWTTMSATDRSKRKRAAEEKNSKLRSPNFSVSRTRLSVRNIPFTLQEKDLKQLFIAAVCCSAAELPRH
ncbi:hypothetical protein ABBQ32_001053 [Trebouxia sp. C0010 RCD-2024]